METANLEALKSTPLAEEMDESEVKALARIVEVHDYADGEVLVGEGTSSPILFVPVSGKITLVKTDEHGEQKVMYSLKPGDLVGELSFMDDVPRYASVIASGPTRVLQLDRQRFEALLPTYPVVVYKSMRAIMRVAHRVQRRLSSQMVDMEHYLYRTGGKY